MNHHGDVILGGDERRNAEFRLQDKDTHVGLGALFDSMARGEFASSRVKNKFGFRSLLELTEHDQELLEQDRKQKRARKEAGRAALSRSEKIFMSFFLK